jgi:membrane protease YdiL (CAAX protease family)
MLPAPLGAIGGLLLGAIFGRFYHLWGLGTAPRARAEVRLRPLTTRRFWTAGVLVAFLIYTLGFMFLMDGLHEVEPTSTPSVLVRTSLICTCLVGPFIEEFWFRGRMLRALEWRMSRSQAAILTAVVFELMHLQLWGLPHRIVTGLVAAGVLYETRSLWAAVLIHVGNNALVFARVRFVDDGFVLSSNGRLLTFATLAVGLSGLAVAYATRRPRPA